MQTRREFLAGLLGLLGVGGGADGVVERFNPYYASVVARVVMDTERLVMDKLLGQEVSLGLQTVVYTEAARIAREEGLDPLAPDFWEEVLAHLEGTQDVPSGSSLSAIQDKKLSSTT